MTRFRASVAAVATVAAFVPVQGQGLEGGAIDSVVRYSDAARPKDVATRLARSGTRMPWSSQRGRLDAVLARLGVPASSQVLVFSKTSSQRDHVGRATPRAIYFNDSVAVAWIPDAPEIEIVSVDALQGVRFHAVDQDPEADGSLVPRSTCLRCHEGPKTRRVPGLLMQSVATDPSGAVRHEYFDHVNGHAARVATRWGGWYVTGAPRDLTHRGLPLAFEGGRLGNDSEPAEAVDVSRYLARSSDIVALLVLQHQVGVVNQAIRAGWDARVDATLEARGEIGREERRRRLNRGARELADQIAMVDETPLPKAVEPVGVFATEYARTGRKDRRGRGLRDLDLRSRLFRWRLSPMVHSPVVQSLPTDLIEAVGHRIRAILATRPRSEATAVREIIADTEPALARRWFGSVRGSGAGGAKAARGVSFPTGV